LSGRGLVNLFSKEVHLVCPADKRSPQPPAPFGDVAPACWQAHPAG
jgi:hypothetical protein